MYLSLLSRSLLNEYCLPKLLWLMTPTPVQNTLISILLYSAQYIPMYSIFTVLSWNHCVKLDHSRGSLWPLALYRVYGLINSFGRCCYLSCYILVPCCLRGRQCGSNDVDWIIATAPIQHISGCPLLPHISIHPYWQGINGRSHNREYITITTPSHTFMFCSDVSCPRLRIPVCCLPYVVLLHYLYR